MKQVKLEPTDDTIKVNDVVFSTMYGKGVVAKVQTGLKYPIDVIFCSNQHASFTAKGHYIIGQCVTLFKCPIDMIDDFASNIYIEYFTEG